jgi:hypothetical protein
VDLFHVLYCSGAMCVGVLVQDEAVLQPAPTHIEQEQYNT